MDLTTLRSGVHNLILDARRLERVINSPEFEALYPSLSQEDKAHVSVLVKQMETNQLVKFIQTRAEREVGELSVRQLRAKASALCISGYSVMSKESLIRAILHETRMRSHPRPPVGMEGGAGVLPQQSEAGTQGPGEVSSVPAGLLAVAS